jgi:hypothetical protein
MLVCYAEHGEGPQLARLDQLGATRKTSCSGVTATRSPSHMSTGALAPRLARTTKPENLPDT